MANLRAIQEMLKTAADTIRLLKQQNAELMEKLAQFQKKERIEHLAQELTRRGLLPELGYQEKVAHLMKVSDDELATYEKLVELTAPKGTVGGLLDSQQDSSQSRLSEVLAEAAQLSGKITF